tara:strand:+ start:262 stop:534 length:273 start_codon:yes stop_codon:yes gene_type:complete
MKKFTGVILTTVFITAVLLTQFDTYIGSWASYALGFLMVVFGYMYKGEANATSCFWFGLFIMSVTFLGANISGKICSDTVEILQESTQKK